jgi:hypothetical protein
MAILPRLFQMPWSPAVTTPVVLLNPLPTLTGFSNNAATYWRAKDELVVSSRENFVMGLDDNTGHLLWILGDPTKQWHHMRIASYALTVTSGGHYPIGQHAVSITTDGQLMLFDNEYASMVQSPAGDSRSVSQPKKVPPKFGCTHRNRNLGCSLTTRRLSSPICSSIYQSGASYLIDYASENWGNVRVLGIDNNDNIAFEFLFAGANWDRGWNALPIRIENLFYK